MDKKQLDVFKEAFRRANYGKVSMPNESIELNKVYEIEFYHGMRDGYSARFFIAKDGNGVYFLELLGSSDYSSWHKRIEQDGTITDLENYEGQFGRTIYPDDPERTEREDKEIDDHNNRLYRELIAKGLERDPGIDDENE